MSTINDISFYKQIAMLPDSDREDVYQYIVKRLEEKSIALPKKPRKAGFAKDFTIVIHEDFDEPLEDFREYLE